MKKLILLVCLLVLLLSLPGVAAATPPEVQEFTLTGLGSNLLDWETLPSGQTTFHLTSWGEVSGDFAGSFTFEEWGIMHPDWSGQNRKFVQITSAAGKMVIRTEGHFSIPDDLVEGTFTVIHAEGAWAGLHGQGTYRGAPGTGGFIVHYTGRFHTHP